MWETWAARLEKVMEGFVSTAQAAELLGISEVAVRRLAMRGRLACVRVADRRMFLLRSVKVLAEDPRYLRQTRRVSALRAQELVGQQVLKEDGDE